MKAKEYAQQLIEANYSPEALYQMTKNLVDETRTIVMSRKCQSYSAINYVFLEINQKYHAIRSIVNKNGNILTEDGFKVCMHKLYEDSPLQFHVDFLKPKSPYVMGVDLATPGNTLEQTEKRLLEGDNPGSKPKGLM